MSRTLYDIMERYKNIWNLCTDDADDSYLDKLDDRIDRIKAYFLNYLQFIGKSNVVTSHGNIFIANVEGKLLSLSTTNL